MLGDCLLSNCTLYLILTLVFIYALYKLTTYSYNFHEKFGYEGPKPLPLIGNIFDFLKDGFHVCDVRNQKRFGHIYPVYLGQIGMLIVSDETLLRQILVKDARSFIDRPKAQVSSKIMKKNLLQLKGKDWERVRALVTPTFTSGKLKKMSPMILRSIKEMMQKFSEAADSDINMKQIFGSLTMDVIAKTMFGIDIDKSANSSHLFVEHGKKLLNVTFSTMAFLLTTLIPPSIKVIEYLFPRGIVAPESFKFLEKALAITIESRRQSTEEFHDFLDLVLKTSNEIENNQQTEEHTIETFSYKKLTEEEILAQSIVFLLAGYETTASALNFCCYYLAKNSEIQEEIYNELLENLPDDKEITLDVLSKLTLLEQSLNETLRICPPVPRFARVCTKDTTLTTSTGQVIQAKKGMIFIVPVYVIHHDERLWPDPDKFDIHRFDQDNKQNLNQYSFLPFGIGPRVCIGQRFALLEAKLALAYLLKDYIILPCKTTPKKLTFGTSVITALKEPVILRIEKR